MSEVDEARDRWEASRRVALIAEESVARAALRYIKLLAHEIFPDVTIMTVVSVPTGGWAWTGFGYTPEADVRMLGVDRAEEHNFLQIQEALLSLTPSARRVWSQAIFEGAVQPYLNLDKVIIE